MLFENHCLKNPNPKNIAAKSPSIPIIAHKYAIELQLVFLVTGSSWGPTVLYHSVSLLYVFVYNGRGL